MSDVFATRATYFGKPHILSVIRDVSEEVARQQLLERRVEERTRLMEKMVGVLEKQLEIVPEDVRARALLAGFYAAFQREDDAIRQIQTAVALRPGDANVLYNAACTYCVLGRKEEGLNTVKQAFAAGYGNRDWASRDPDLAILRDDPEFRRLCATAGGSG